MKTKYSLRVDITISANEAEVEILQRTESSGSVATVRHRHLTFIENIHQLVRQFERERESQAKGKATAEGRAVPSV